MKRGMNPSSGSLQSGTTGDCLGSVVGGVYKADTTLADSNYVDVKVDVTTAGDYTISTDTINGFYFSGAGLFTATVKIQFVCRETENRRRLVQIFLL